MKILVTGAGGPAGVCTIKALRGKHKITAVDIDNLASGLYLADKSYIVPLAKDKKFISKIFEIAKKENISLIIPTVSEELPKFAKNVNLFNKKNIKVVISNLKSIEIANNKLSTYNFFKDDKYCPKIYTKSNVRFPCVVKPVNSRGSRGFHICFNRNELKVALNRNRKNFKKSLIMEYINGIEYSVYGVSDLRGKPLISIANKRIQASGESKKAQVISNKNVCELANEIAYKLKLIGPWNVQLMDSGNSLKLIEVNPRIAGTTSLVIASGLNFIDLIIKVFTNKKIYNSELSYSPNIIMTRYNEEIFFKPEKVISNV